MGIFSRNTKEPKTKSDITQPARTTPAETAYLIGPGSLRVKGELPIWKPVKGDSIKLHPEFLKRIIVFGLADCSGKAFSLLWRKNIQVIFLSPHGNSVLAHIQPAGDRPGLSRRQHLAAADRPFALSIAREVVTDKIAATAETARYFQRQGSAPSAGKLLKFIESVRRKIAAVNSQDQLLGIEGSVAKLWWKTFAEVIPREWKFTGRKSYPPADHTNAILSLGYTLLVSRCQTLIAAFDMDPFTGFMHQIRPGRPSLACDLIEPLRVPFIDRWVCKLLGRKVLTKESFEKKGGLLKQRKFQLTKEAFKVVISSFETEFSKTQKEGSWEKQIVHRIERLSRKINQRI